MGLFIKKACKSTAIPGYKKNYFFRGNKKLFMEKLFRKNIINFLGYIFF